MTSEVGEIMKKLKDKKAEYEAIALSDRSSVNPTQYCGSSLQQYMPLGSQAQAEVQRLRDQIAQMLASTVEQIAQLKAEAASREVEVQRKYEEL
ncbi:WD repeat- and FYVE domain-containing 4 [Gossypium arboreum]|uniref:WD repeat-and FYVE domain-containing 4 n=1 Tax=Gossypium arboreum TaxID=29729 RepID=A0A0B0MYF3_GOSAR|nr:WD repeat- and FYVE domain-containing 4 [Gossypium arboreum]